MNTALRIIELALEWACYCMAFMVFILGLFLAGWVIQEFLDDHTQAKGGG